MEDDRSSPRTPPPRPSETSPRRPCSPVSLLVTFSAAGLLAFLFRDSPLFEGWLAGVPAGAPRLVILALGLALAGCLLFQAVCLRRVRASLRACEVEEARCGEFSESHLDSVLRAATRVSVIATDLDGVIRLFNSGAERMLGYRAEELVGRLTPAAIHLATEVEAYGEELSRRLGHAVQGFDVFVALAREGGAEAFDAHEWTYVRKDGGHVPVQLTVTGVYAPTGALTGFLGVAVDLTERKALEAGLRQAQVSVDNAQDLIFWASAIDGRYAYANAAVTRHLGYSREELLGMTVVDLNPARTISNWRETVEELRRLERKVWQGELRRKDGNQLPVEFHVTLISHEGEEYVLGVMRDISGRLALEAHLRQAQLSMDRAEDLILWVRISDRSICYANEAVCRSLGYTQDEILGMDARAVNPQRGDNNWAELTRTLRQGGVSTFEVYYRRKDGSMFPVETKASLIEHEGVEYAVGIARDLTERKLAEQRLQAEALLNRSLVQVSRELISAEPDLAEVARMLLGSAREMTGSKHGYVSVVDLATGHLMPHTTTAMVAGDACAVQPDQPIFLANPDGSHPGLWGHGLNLRQGFYDNNPESHPSARGLPPGHVPLRQFLSVPALVKGRLVAQVALANPGRDFNDSDLATAQALADIFALGVEQVLSRRALLEAKDAAEASNRAKGEFLANMTHEVRTPLNGVLGMLQVLRAGALDESQQESVDVAMLSAERLHLLLSNVLEYARLEADQNIPVDCRSFPAGDLLKALDAAAGRKARAKGLGFEAVVEPGLPEFLRSDAALLRQCLEHLLDNAVKFTASGSIRLSAGPGEGGPAAGGLDAARVAFRVEDTGIGIPAEAAESLFGAFVQADAGINRVYGGAGLGMAIARRLARRLGGDIQARPREGGGTVMILTVLADCSTPTPSAPSS